MKTGTIPNINLTAQFPPLTQHINNTLSKNMLDELSSDDNSLTELFNKRCTKEH